MSSTHLQLRLPLGGAALGIEPRDYQGGATGNARANKLDPSDRPFHDWYRFVLSYPPHLVREYIRDFEVREGGTVLDPFAGTGTTVVESRLHGLKAIGIEANPLAHFACSTKTDWEVDPDMLEKAAVEIADAACDLLASQGIGDNESGGAKRKPLQLRALDAEAEKLLLAGSISPLPLHKTLVLLDCIERRKAEHLYRYALLSLANSTVFKISNLHFGPEVGVRGSKSDAPVIAAWLEEMRGMARDLRLVAGKEYPPADVLLGDARAILDSLEPETVDAVITSPPYPNEKDYTRTTRLESVILGFIRNRADLRALKKTLIRSNTRGVYKNDDDDKWVAEHAEIQRISEAIESRRVELGKTSGFERMYARVTRLYFGGMRRHLARLRPALRPGARLAYVVGDQASYLRVMIRTGRILASIAADLGYQVERIDLFRTRRATATRAELREEVLVLRWPGRKGTPAR